MAIRIIVGLAGLLAIVQGLAADAVPAGIVRLLRWLFWAWCMAVWRSPLRTRQPTWYGLLRSALLQVQTY